MRARLALLAILLLGVVLALGCGSKFDLPTEHLEGRTVPASGDYQMIYTWHSMANAQDVLLTPGTSLGHGSQLFVLFHPDAGPVPKGEVAEYFLARQERVSPPAANPMQTLLNPFAMCAGGDGSGSASNRIYVLDQGDTCLAKTRNGSCGGPFITNLGYFWRVREYGLTGGDTLTTFTDTTFAWVNGVAADAEGSVYVSGVAVVVAPASDPRLFVRTFIYRVYKYRRGPRYPGVVPNDRTMPGADWHRDTTYFHTEGNGVGYVRDPRGMAWNGANTPGLYVADFGNNSGEKLSDTDTTGYFRMETDNQGVGVVGPVDLGVDASGFSYLCDTGNRRVLRFGRFGEFVQRVDIKPNDLALPLLKPTGVAANDSVVYVADHDRGEVVIYQRH